MRHIVAIDDLSDSAVDAILDRADALSRHDGPWPQHSGLVAATVFLTSSLRTRTGFTAAVLRLGGSVIDVSELRADATMSTGESFHDTLRTLSGMVDVVITRTPFALADIDLTAAVCPLVNGGDGRVEHPTQALIDVSAMTAFSGSLADLHLAICGDATMRAVTSLLTLLGRRPPRKITLVSPPSRTVPVHALPATLRPIAVVEHEPRLDDVDVLYLPGLPMRRGDDVLDDTVRSRFAFGDEVAARLPDHAIVLSPLPVIDEIGAAQRADPRLRIWEQSDRGVAVRAAVIEWVLAQEGVG